MKFIKTNIPEVVIIEPKTYNDDRGYFLESYNMEVFRKNIGNIHFVQDNESKSTKGVLRGLHFQKPPFTQAKLVRCIEGVVIDVAVDIRQGSPTFGKHVSVELTSDNKKQLFVPRGFAHGYAVLSETAIFAYKVDNIYAPEYDSGILWNDTELNIDWKLTENEMILSDKDFNLASLAYLDNPFQY